MSFGIETAPGVVRERRLIGEDSRLVQVIRCTVCHEEDFARPRNGNFLPPNMLSKVFRNRGWVMGRRGSHVCANCSKPN
jgi:hypothetical protein